MLIFSFSFRLGPVETIKTAKVMKRRGELEENRYHLNSKLQEILAKKELVRYEENVQFGSLCVLIVSVYSAFNLV